MIDRGVYQTDCALAEASRTRHTLGMAQIFNAANEREVSQGFLSIYDLDIHGKLEKYRVDYAHPELWLEIKFDINMSDRAVRCKVIAQMLHYLHYAPVKRGELTWPNGFGIVDKSHIMLYDTANFGKYIISPKYYKDVKSPSCPHPELERDLFGDSIIQADMLHILNEYSLVWAAFNERGIYDT